MMRPYVAILIAGALAQALLLGETDDGCGGMTPIGCTADHCPYECDTPFFDEQEPDIVVNNAAIQAQENFDADLEAELLQKDLATYRCDEPRLTHLMLSMNNQQRRMLFVPYKNKFGKDLISEIQRLCRRDFKNVMVALLESPTTLDVKQLRYSMKGLGTTERILIEILATRNNTELAAIRAEYQKAYGHSLESDVIGDTSGSFRQLLVSLLQGRRSESSWVDFSSAYQEAYKLSEACKRKARDLDADFNRVLVTQSYVQLRRIFEYFKEMAGYTIEQAITKFFRRDTRRGFLAVVASAVNKPKFFAQQLYASMKGLGTRDNDLIRLIVSRAEIDMAAISDEFEVAYGKTLVDYICGDTSGGYRDALIAIVKGNSKYRY